jgi:hypothetical protein
MPRNHSKSWRPASLLVVTALAVTAAVTATPAKAADNYACNGPVPLGRGITATACLESGDLSGNVFAEDYGTKVDFSGTTGRYRSCHVYMEYVEAGKTARSSVSCFKQANLRRENKPAAHAGCKVGDRLQWHVYVKYTLLPTRKVTHRTPTVSVAVYCRDV